MLGEGTFLNLLAFLERHAPDAVTRQVCRLALQDEARHVAFGLAHLEHQAAGDPSLRTACGRRSSAATTPWPTPPASTRRSSTPWSCWPPARGSRPPWPRATAGSQQLQAEMDEGRQRRLVRLGFPPAEAAALSALHTRNFM